MKVDLVEKGNGSSNDVNPYLCGRFWKRSGMHEIATIKQVNPRCIAKVVHLSEHPGKSFTKHIIRSSKSPGCINPVYLGIAYGKRLYALVAEGTLYFNTEETLPTVDAKATLEDWVRKYIKRVKEIEVTYGGDPEVLFYRDGEFVEADELYDSYYDKIGCDGNSSTGELRPSPVRDPDEIAKEIKSLLQDIHYDYPDVEVYAGGGGDGNSTGGHIHFGGIKYTDSLIHVLDEYIGIPLKGVPGGRRYGYGANSDIEEKPYGFEYRTPPSFIVNPAITKAVYRIVNMIIRAASKGKDIPIPPVYEALVENRKDAAAVKYYKWFLKHGTFRNELISTWLGGKAAVKAKYVTYSDDWSYRPRLEVNSDLVLYGLSRERYKETPFALCSKEKHLEELKRMLPSLEWKCDAVGSFEDTDRLAIGLPYERRMASLGEIKEMVSRIIFAVDKKEE